jgi:hypothetical protein
VAREAEHLPSIELNALSSNLNTAKKKKMLNLLIRDAQPVFFFHCFGKQI